MLIGRSSTSTSCGTTAKVVIRGDIREVGGGFWQIGHHERRRHLLLRFVLFAEHRRRCLSWIWIRRNFRYRTWIAMLSRLQKHLLFSKDPI